MIDYVNLSTLHGKITAWMLLKLSLLSYIKFIIKVPYTKKLLIVKFYYRHQYLNLNLNYLIYFLEFLSYNDIIGIC